MLIEQFLLFLPGYFYDGQLSLNLCGWVEPWSGLSKGQKRNLKFLYETNCDCKVRVAKPVLSTGEHLMASFVNKPLTYCTQNNQGLVVQSIVSLTSLLRGQLIKCFTTL